MNSPCHDIWAKDPESAPYPLLGHLLDTATVAGAVWDHWLRPGLRAHLTAAISPGDEDHTRSVLMLLAGIHDLGKANPVFTLQAADSRDLPWRGELAQQLAEQGLRHADGASVDLIRATHQSAARRHEYIGMVGLLGENPNPVDRKLLPGAWGAAVVGGHHGAWQVAAEDADIALRLTTGPWGDQQRAHQSAVEDAVGVTFEGLRRLSPKEAPRITVLLTGLVMLADWLSSQEDTVAQGRTLYRSGQPLDATWMSARGPLLTKAVKTQIGSYVQPEDPHATILGGRTPRPLQADAITKVRGADGLWIVAYPTGEGKTEAALLRHAARPHEGLVFALPTRATTDAMTDRLRDTFHGTGNLVVKSHQFAAADTSTACECCPSGGYSADWFFTSVRRLVAPIAVMTCDQVLMGSLRQRHAPLRLLALANHHVVIDEVHTFDHYQIELLIEMLAWLGATGARVTLLSATMPIWMQQRLAAAYTQDDGKTAIPTAVYPSHRLVDHTGSAVHTPSTTSAAVLGIDAVKSADSLSDHINWASRAAAEHPECHIAIVTNTVTNCVELAETLAYRLPHDDVMCLHSRMTQGHRARVENELLARTGPDESLHGRRVILVATQVVEASLDVDFDLMATDIAPSASLVQRAGRLWRFHSSPSRARRHAASAIPPTRTLRVLARTDSNGDLTLGPCLPYLAAEMQRVWTHGLSTRTRLLIPGEVQDFVDSTTVDLETFHALLDQSSPDAQRELVDMTNRLKAAMDAKANIASEIAAPKRSRYAALVSLTTRDDDEEMMMTRFIERQGHTYLLIDPSKARPDITETSPQSATSIARTSAAGVPRLLRCAVAVTASNFDEALLAMHARTLVEAEIDDWEPRSQMLAGLLPLDVALFRDAADYLALTGLIPLDYDA